MKKSKNTNEIVPAQSTTNLASNANDKQQLSPAYAYNTCKLPEHKYAADDNPDDADTKESYEPELLENMENQFQPGKMTCHLRICLT